MFRTTSKPPTSAELHIHSPRVAEAYDEAAKDTVITTGEADYIVAAAHPIRIQPGFAPEPRPSVRDLERIAAGAKNFFERRLAWPARESFDRLVETGLVSPSGLDRAGVESLARSLGSIEDAASLAHAARAIEKLRANEAFAPCDAETLSSAYYAKLQELGPKSSYWPGKAVFDSAVEDYLGAGGTPSPRRGAPLERMIYALGSITSVESVPYVLRGIEKIRANGVKSEPIDDALYQLLQRMDGPVVVKDGYASFVDQLCALRGRDPATCS